jgi:hypothetical protein
VPAPYPYTIVMTGNNPSVQDVELLNSYNGISAVGAARHYIARVQGQPTNVGWVTVGPCRHASRCAARALSGSCNSSRSCG